MKVLVIASFAESMLQFRGPLVTAIAARWHKVHVAAPDALAQAMQCFISDLSLATLMGQRSRQMVEHNMHKVNAVMLQEMGF